MLKLTRVSATLVDTEVDPATQIFYVKDEDYVSLSRDKDIRLALLEQLDVEVLLIDRLGNEIEPGLTYEKRNFKVGLPEVPVRKEMGYHHRL
jgi:hypothetical protein